MTTALTRGGDVPAPATAIALWADATTDAISDRRHDLLRDKRRILGDFFAIVHKPSGQVSPLDVKRWQGVLEERGLTAGIVNGRLARVSSFYQWARSDPMLAAALPPALVQYLSASDRLSPRNHRSGRATTSPRRRDSRSCLHAFAHNLKVYAAVAGIGSIHIHQTRYSFARLVADQTGSLTEVQVAVGHNNVATLRIYVRQVAVKRDQHSVAIGDRLEIAQSKRLEKAVRNSAAIRAARPCRPKDDGSVRSNWSIACSRIQREPCR